MLLMEVTSAFRFLHRSMTQRTRFSFLQKQMEQKLQVDYSSSNELIVNYQSRGPGSVGLIMLDNNLGTPVIKWLEGL
jgi:hypothetical protein